VGGDDEFMRIDRIAAVLGAHATNANVNARAGGVVSLGIGDDCAVLDPSKLEAGEKLVWTIDASVEGVHFRRELLSWEDVGFRATVAAASDLLAMGARPIAMLVAWTLPRDAERTIIDAIAEGQRVASHALGASIVGGNISSAEELSLTTTAIGASARPVLRSGARVGDRLVIAGVVGEAALGLSWLMRGRDESGAARLVDRWRNPRILLAESRSLAAVATAMIDVSDGLAQDVGHLAKASKVRARIDLASLAARRSEEAKSIADLLRQPIEHVELAGGEDYALVATVPADATLPANVDVIGAIEEGEGVIVVGVDGKPYEAPPAGWVHR
jgi:thiamine-monophosphate kinase